MILLSGWGDQQQAPFNERFRRRREMDSKGVQPFGRRRRNHPANPPKAVSAFDFTMYGKRLEPGEFGLFIP
jgi:hypothetical protein